MAGSALVVGGTSGIGRVLARHLAASGGEVVVSGRDKARADTVAAELTADLGAGGGTVRGLALDLRHPDGLAAALADVGRVDHLVLAAVEREQNTVAGYDHRAALELVTLKLVGYTEVIHTLVPRMDENSSIVLFGGLAKDRPYPGSTTVSTVNGGVTGLTHTLAVELAPIRVNAIHPGIVGDSPFWNAKPPGALDQYISRTPTGRLATMADVVDAVDFLLRNPSVNGVNLAVDGGWLLT